MTEPWELTHYDITEALRDPRDIETVISDWLMKEYHIIATAAVKKYQEWLAAQCGPNPEELENGIINALMQNRMVIYKARQHSHMMFVYKRIAQHFFALGQQAGLSKGLERGKHE